MLRCHPGRNAARVEGLGEAGQSVAMGEQGCVGELG